MHRHTWQSVTTKNITFYCTPTTRIKRGTWERWSGIGSNGVVRLKKRSHVGQWRASPRAFPIKRAFHRGRCSSTPLFPNLAAAVVFNLAHQQSPHRRRKLAAAKEEFILEKAAAEMKQKEAAKANADFNSQLVQRKVELDSREDDLADREQKLADKLQAKDVEIQALIAKRTQELEDIHQEAIQAQAMEHAGKLKETVEAAEAAKANLDAQVKELEEKLAASNNEIHVLKESAQKAAYSLGELQSSLSSKNKELQAAGDVNADLKLKLSTLEGTLEVAREKERDLVEKLGRREEDADRR